MVQRLAQASAALALTVWLTACSGGGITVTEAWVRNSPMVERAGAAYLTLANTGSSDDRLLSVTADVAQMAELHETKEQGGMMEMSPVEFITVPANGQVELKPGGLHIMLMGLSAPLDTGDQVTLTLKFERAGEITVAAEVRDE